jgi:hypothetical protein
MKKQEVVKINSAQTNSGENIRRRFMRLIREQAVEVFRG